MLTGANVHSGLFFCKNRISMARTCGIPSLSGANFDGINLIINLSGANVTEADLTNTVLANAHLGKANLSKRIACRTGGRGGGACFHTHLENVQLQQASLLHADFREKHLDSTNLSEADLSEADMSDVIFECRHIAGRNIEQNRCARSQKLGLDLREVHLREALLDRGGDEANMEAANLEGGTLRAVNERWYPNLRNANLRGEPLRQQA